MTRIVGVAGSLRRGSLNAALLRAAAELVPEGVSLDVTTIEGIPVYDGDVETTEGIPSAVAALKERIAAADGLILATPEYNQSMAGPLKNAVDWLSRPPADIPRVFRNRPVGIVGASAGAAGTRLAQAAWLPTLRGLKMRPWFDQALFVGNAGDSFDDAGRLVDEGLRSRIEKYVEGFAAFAAARRS